MNIPFRSFTDSVRDMSTAITASSGKLVDVSVGSVLRAIIEANAAIVSWVQWLILLTLQTTRASTSAGNDLDSWMADFSLSRLPAAAATGMVTFSRLATAVPARVPAGVMVKTQDGSTSFIVTIDPAHPAWQVNLNTYSVDIGAVSLTLPVMAVTPGRSGNVLPNTITLIASALAGIDFVNNAAGITGGGDPETDEEFRRRFQNFFAARSRGTVEAIGYAVSQVRRDLKHVIQENTDAAGNIRMGNILVIVDDGTGVLPDALRASLAASIDTVRPVGTMISIQPPEIVQVQILAVMEFPSSLSVDTMRSEITVALQAYVNKRSIGGTLSISRMIQMLYQAQPGIINISKIQLNGQSEDLRALSKSSFKFQSVIFN